MQSSLFNTNDGELAVTGDIHYGEPDRIAFLISMSSLMEARLIGHVLQPRLGDRLSDRKYLLPDGSNKPTRDHRLSASAS